MDESDKAGLYSLQGNGGNQMGQKKKRWRKMRMMRRGKEK